MARTGRPKKSVDVECTCRRCGRPFSVPGWQKYGRDFCSHECYREYRKETAVKPGPSVELICVECGKPYKTHPCRAKTSKYCSRECSFASTVGEVGRPDWGNAVEKTCPTCGEQFFAGGYDGRLTGRRSRKQVFCSLECKRAAHYKPGALSKELSPTDAAHIAGLVEGEGCILIYQRKPTIKIRVTIANNRIALLDWMCQVTGVGSIVRKPRKSGSKHADAYTWQAHSETAESLLRQIRPYMVIKTEQADLAISVQENLRVPSLKADYTWQQEAFDRMHRLNRRGPDDPTDNPTID